MAFARGGLAALILGLALLPASAQDEEAFAALRPPMLTRADWQAKPPLPGLVPQDIAGIVVHHTGEKQNTRIAFANKLRNLQSYSQRPAELAPGRTKPAWPDLPYHFYIDANGEIAEGRDLRYAGSTNTNYDPTGYIQVVVEGNFDIEEPKPAQVAAVRRLLLWLLLKQGLPVKAVSVHKDHAATSCPGRRFLSLMPGLMTELSSEYGRVRKR